MLMRGGLGSGDGRMGDWGTGHCWYCGMGLGDFPGGCLCAMLVRRGQYRRRDVDYCSSRVSLAHVHDIMLFRAGECSISLSKSSEATSSIDRKLRVDSDRLA